MAKDDPEKPDYYQLQELTRQHLEAAKTELARIDRERNTLIDRIHQMEVLVGIRTYPTRKRRGRIKSEELKQDIVAILAVASQKKLSAAEILSQLIESRSYPHTRSLRTRVYSSLSKWAKEGELLERAERGVYRLLP